MRICLVTNEMLGAFKNGGIGTSTTFLAFALSAMDHDVEILHFGRKRAIDEPWASRYADEGIRVTQLAASSHRTRPVYIAQSAAIYQHLSTQLHDVVIFQDTSGPGYCSMRAKQVGLAFQDTLLIHYSHSPTAWISEANERFPITTWELAANAMERLSAELADVVVSPSNYMLTWMRDNGWRLPDSALVIPYLSAGTVHPEWIGPTPAEEGSGDIANLVFFGRLEERKGIRVFIDALANMDPKTLQGRRVTFMGRMASWTPSRIKKAMAYDLRRVLAGVDFDTNLAHEEALAKLARPGTLAVMPSLTDNSPCVIYECMEWGIRFITSSAGGGPELIHASSPEQFVFEPDPRSLATALELVISTPGALANPVPSFSRETQLRRWEEVLARRTASREPLLGQPLVSVVITASERPELVADSLDGLARQTYRNLEVIVVDGQPMSNGAIGALDKFENRSWPWPFELIRQDGPMGVARNKGWRTGKADLVLFVDEGDIPKEDLVASLVHAWQRSNADVVTCGLRLWDDSTPISETDSGSTTWLFVGEPQELGLIENQFGGATSLWTKKTLESLDGFCADAAPSGEWALLCRASLSGFRIISIPEALIWHRVRDNGKRRTMRTYGELISGNAHETQRALSESVAESLPDGITLLPAMVHLLYNDRTARRQLDRDSLAETGLSGSIARMRVLMGSFVQVVSEQGVRVAVERSVAWLRGGA